MIFLLLGTEFHANCAKLSKRREEYRHKINNGLWEVKE